MDNVDVEKAGPGITGRMIFLWIVLLDTLLIYFQEYTPSERFMNLSSVRLGADPAPVYWVIAAADLISRLFFARLLMAELPSAADKRRWLTVILGGPLLFCGLWFFDYTFVLLQESFSGSPDLFGRLALCIGGGGAAAAGCALFTAMARTERSGAMIREMGPLLLRQFPLALLLGPPVFVLRTLSIVFLALPLAGPLILAAFNLWIALWFFRSLATMVKPRGPSVAPVHPPLIVAFAGGSLTVVLIGLAVVFVPGPRHNLDAEPAPAIVLHDLKVSPSKYEPRGDKVIVSSKELEVVIGKDPFDIAVLDRNHNVLLGLCNDPKRSADYRGVALNRELRAMHTFPLLGPGRIIGARVRLSSLVMDQAESISQSSGEVIAESRVKDRPLVTTFSFYDQDILKITVDPGSRSPVYSTSISFLAGADDHFLGLGGGSEQIDHRGSDLDLMIQDRPGPMSGRALNLVSFLTAGRLSFSAGRGNPWPVPFVLISRGVGIFLDETADPRIELGSRYPDAIRFSGRGGPLNLYIITGATPLEIVRKFGRLTGQDAELPAAALLPWAQVESSGPDCASAAVTGLSAIRKAGVPAAFAYLAGPACAGRQEVIKKGAAQGFSFVTGDRAWLAPGDGEYQEALKNNYLVMNRLGLPYHYLTARGTRVMLDFTNPATVKWRAGKWVKLKQEGFSGLVLDGDCLIPPDSILYTGDPGYLQRNLYPLLYAKAVSGAAGKELTVFSSRGYAGMERFVPLVWPDPGPANGEQDTPLGAAVAQMINMSVSGIPPTGPARTDGRGSTLDPQAAVASASPLFILPAGVFGNGVAGGGADTVKQIKYLAEMHARLFPYLYSLAIMHERGGYPLIQTPALRDPADPAWYHNSSEYLIGDGLLAVPPAGPDNMRRVHFPPGKWTNLETLESFGPGDHDLAGVTTGLMLFLAEGSLLPLFAEPFQTLRPGTDQAITGSLESGVTLMWIAGPPAAFTLFDDTRITVRRVADSILARSAGKAGRDFTWRILNCDQPLAVFVNQVRLDDAGIEYQPRSRILTVPDVAGPDYEMEVVLKPTGQ
ncbi:MAG TPA: TIM-barrel domain-containing protein [bacterium]|nr:TIM-barrel domain-containing protein [bacterium]